MCVEIENRSGVALLCLAVCVNKQKTKKSCEENPRASESTGRCSESSVTNFVIKQGFFLATAHHSSTADVIGFLFLNVQLGPQRCVWEEFWDWTTKITSRAGNRSFIRGCPSQNGIYGHERIHDVKWYVRMTSSIPESAGHWLLYRIRLLFDRRICFVFISIIVLFNHSTGRHRTLLIKGLGIGAGGLRQ